jgi:hypothetical protein
MAMRVVGWKMHTDLKPNRIWFDAKTCSPRALRLSPTHGCFGRRGILSSTSGVTSAVECMAQKLWAPAAAGAIPRRRLEKFAILSAPSES